MIYYIVIFAENENIISNIEFFFIKYNIKIILYKNLIELKEIISNNNFIPLIFIKKILYPHKNFIDELESILNNPSINYISLSKNNDIFLVKSHNITIKDNIFDIKQENNINIIFDEKENSNLIDNIIPPEDINFDYNKLLKLNTFYDNIINFNVAYKAYEKYLKYIVKNNYCYNIILFINKISDLDIIIPKYEFYRITLFYTIKNKKNISKINLFCKNNNILSHYYLNNDINTFFNLNNHRSIWFEKIIFLQFNNNLNDDLFKNLNDYHNIKTNIILKNVISISSSDFICLNCFNKNIITITNTDEIYNILINYISNLQNTYIIKNLEYKKININDIILDNTYIENQLMITRNYNLVLDNINKNIKENYNSENVFKLLTKKISISILCKNDNDIIKESNIIIDSVNDIKFLSDLVLLFSNIKNNNIMNKLYIKILKISNENNDTVSQITLKAFYNLIFLSNPMTEESLISVMDFLINNYENKLIPNDKLKSIIMSILLNITKFIEKNSSIIDKLNTIIYELYDIKDIMNIENLIVELSDLNKTNNNICLLHFLIFITTNFSAYYESFDQFIDKRNDIQKQLEYLNTLSLPTCKLNEVVILPVCNFYLSYQGIPSVNIFKLKLELIRKICPDLNYEINIDFNNTKKNICFHSNYLTRWHSVFKDRHIIIKELSKYDNYNIYFTTFDDLNEEVKYLFGNAKHIKLPNKLNEIKDIMTNLQLDVLIYCEIGMDPKTYFMAHMRLAKKQINTWGHSDTSGINTIDYFISSKYYELELELSQKHYSEKLILLDSLCTSYVNPLSRANINFFKNRLHYGFTDEITIFSCTQSLFKFNPIFDEYLINILLANDNFILIILNGDNKEKIFKRFNNKNISSKIHIFPMMQHFQYLNLINISDIILDPYPFGGCNSSLEAFALNKVVVTQESNMINGRFTSGFYKKMNLDSMITKSKEEYINLAIKLGTDVKFRESISEQISNNNIDLFNDKNSIIDWKNFIDNIS